MLSSDCPKTLSELRVHHMAIGFDGNGAVDACFVSCLSSQIFGMLVQRICRAGRYVRLRPLPSPGQNASSTHTSRVGLRKLLCTSSLEPSTNHKNRDGCRIPKTGRRFRQKNASRPCHCPAPDRSPRPRAASAGRGAGTPRDQPPAWELLLDKGLA